MKLSVYARKITVFFAIAFPVMLSSCTVFDTVGHRGHVLVGRNFDWEKSNGQINFVPASDAKHGMVLLSLDDPDMPYDGMNDAGLSVAIAAVPHSETPLNSLKPLRKSLEMVKVVLQEASTVEEALKLFNRYGVVFGEFLGNPLVHFKLTDRHGHSAVVEFVHNRMVVIRGRKSRIITNHYLSDSAILASSKTSHRRYETVRRHRDHRHTVRSVFELLDRVRQADTAWSTVWDLSTQKLYIQYKNHPRKIFDLKNELYHTRTAFFYDMRQQGKRKKIAIKGGTFTQVRPHVGYGQNGLKHYGFRVLLPAGTTQSYGLEVTKFKSASEAFTAMGIVIEQRKWGWLNMSVGTIGYFGYGKKKENAVGMVSNLGWEPDNHLPFKPFVTYRSDVVFTKGKTDVLNSISAGFKFEF